MVQNYHASSSIYIKWQDKRHIEGNEARNVSCKSQQVDWTKEGQFWLPNLDVRDDLKLVRFGS